MANCMSCALVGDFRTLTRHPCRIQATCIHIRIRCALTSFYSGDCVQTFAVTFLPDICKAELLCNRNMFADPSDSENTHVWRDPIHYKSPLFPRLLQLIQCSSKSNNLKIKFTHTVRSFQCCEYRFMNNFACTRT